MSDAGKLQIDDDWKSEAQREKEKLAEQVDDRAGMEHGLPAADFTGLLNMLAMQAMAGLGAMREADGQMMPPNPEVAKYYIDLLDVIEQKTKGNLKEEEKKLLDTALYQLRLAYVELMNAIQASVKRGGQVSSSRPAPQG